MRASKSLSADQSVIFSAVVLMPNSLFYFLAGMNVKDPNHFPHQRIIQEGPLASAGAHLIFLQNFWKSWITAKLIDIFLDGHRKYRYLTICWTCVAMEDTVMRDKRRFLAKYFELYFNNSSSVARMKERKRSQEKAETSKTKRLDWPKKSWRFPPGNDHNVLIHFVLIHYVLVRFCPNRECPNTILS